MSDAPGPTRPWGAMRSEPTGISLGGMPFTPASGDFLPGWLGTPTTLTISGVFDPYASVACEHCGVEPSDATINGVEYRQVRVHRSLDCPGALLDVALHGSIFAELRKETHDE